VLVLVVPYSVHTTQHNKCINIRPQLKSVWLTHNTRHVPQHQI